MNFPKFAHVEIPPHIEIPAQYAHLTSVRQSGKRLCLARRAGYQQRLVDTADYTFHPIARHPDCLYEVVLLCGISDTPKVIESWLVSGEMEVVECSRVDFCKKTQQFCDWIVATNYSDK
jgi:hypothetical protein